jgi:ribose transport system permease protein
MGNRLGLIVSSCHRVIVSSSSVLAQLGTRYRLVGILVMVLVLYGFILASDSNARSMENQQNIAQRTGFFGVLTLGAGVLIISGGIDLSIGSVVGLGAVTFALLLERRWPPALAITLVLLEAGTIGLAHGLLVTKLRLQPFIVTLCGLFIYRGLARWATWTPQGSSRAVGIGGRPDLADLRFLAIGEIYGIPVIFLLLLVIAAVTAVLLHFSVYGRYLYAVGYNEQAARYAGVQTDRYKILAYVLCSLLAGLGGILHMLDLETAQPSSAGSWYELYAITGAVLGGCSLRGGEGTVPGILLGTAVLPLLRNLCQFAGVPSDLEFTVIGMALLVGTVVDELIKRRKSS